MFHLGSKARILGSNDNGTVTVVEIARQVLEYKIPILDIVENK